MKKSSIAVPPPSDLDLQIETILRHLQIDGTLDGMHYLIHAIHTAVMDPTTPGRITKSIYIDTAIHCGTKPKCVERSIRTAIKNSWDHGGRGKLEELVGSPLVKRPTNAQFIDLVATYIRCH